MISELLGREVYNEMIKEGTEGYQGKRIAGFRKWATKPDVYDGGTLDEVTIMSGVPHSQGVPKPKTHNGHKIEY